MGCPAVHKSTDTFAPRCHHARAFTLIELLVVVAIMVALLAILLPSLNQALAVGQTTVCTSNVRQIAIAHLSYAGDNFGVHPPSSTNPLDYHWLHLLEFYHEGIDELRFCPASERNPGNTGIDMILDPRVWGDRTTDWWLFTNTYGVLAKESGSYGVNIRTHSTAGWGSDVTKHFKSIGDTPNAGAVPLMGDARWHNGSANDTDLPSNVEGEPAGNGEINRFMIARHLGDSIAMSFLDGSARPVQLNHLWDMDWHRGFSRTAFMDIPWLND